MSSKWGQYLVDEPGQIESQPEINDKWSKYSIESEKSIGEKAKKIASDIGEGFKGTGRLIGKTAIAATAAPAKGIGGLLNLISKAGVEGDGSGLKGAGTRMVKSAGKWFSDVGEQGQRQLLKELESLIGKSSSKFEDVSTGIATRAADIYGSGPFKGMGAASVAGGTAGELAKELGGGELSQTLAEIGGMGLPGIAKGLTALERTPKVAESGLQLPKIIEKESIKGIKPKISESRKEKILSNVTKQSEELIEKIKKEKIPISKEIDQGIDVSAKNEQNFDKISIIASKLPEKIKASNISDYLKSVKNRISESPIPSDEQENILKLVDKFGEKFGGKNAYLAKDYLNQYRNINKDIKSLYETKFVHGERLETMKFFEGLKNSMAKTLEEGTPKGFAELFNETNKEFSSIKKLEKFENIMASVQSSDGRLNPDKLNRFLSNNKKSNVLRKQIGDDGFNKIKAISDDLYKTKDKMKLFETEKFDFIKNEAGATILKYLGFPFAGKIAGALLGKESIARIRGFMLTSTQGAGKISNFLKAIRSQNPKMIKKTATSLVSEFSKYLNKNNDQAY